MRNATHAANLVYIYQPMSNAMKRTQIIVLIGLVLFVIILLHFRGYKFVIA